MRVLVLNAGSSSLKASILQGGGLEALASANVDWGADATRAADRDRTLAEALDGLQAALGDTARIDGVGHRVVHGGEAFRAPTLIDEQVIEQLRALVDLAPLHIGVALETIAAARRALPDVAHAAVFDTGFHAELPIEAYVYPLPWHWHTDWGVRRYGFHGLSLSWAVRRAAELLGRPAAELGLIVAHLGSGCSVTAIEAGRSRATSMGMTPLEGLMMGTRAGSVDPGALLDVLRRARVTAGELAEALDHESGLLGLSGVSGDVRLVRRAAEQGDERARLALAIFVRRAAEGIAAALTSLDRLDGLVFTGGIGENDGSLRARIVERLAMLGLPAIDEHESGEDRLLSRAGPPHVLRIEAREDVVIAEAVAELLGA